MRLISKLLGSTILALATLSASASNSLFVFGDSLSDSGNNSNVPQIGADPSQVITGNFYIPSQTYSPAPFGTYSNGPVWASQFAAMIGSSAFPSLAGGTNYAFGGATTSGGQVPSLLDQTAIFLAAHNNSAPSDALYVVAGGGNNARAAIQSLLFQPNFGIIGATAGAAAAQYASDIGSIVDQLQAAGAQNIIVWNAPNLGLAPAITSLPFATASGLSGSQLASLVSGTLNGALGTRMATEVGVKVFDLYGILDRAPVSFSNRTDACGAPSNSAICPADIANALFWDGIHPTTSAHGYIAGEMFALAAVPEPAEFAMMLAGILLVAGIAKRRSMA